MGTGVAGAGYVTTLAGLAFAGHAGFTALVGLRSAPGSSTLAALCAALAAAAVWPRRPAARPRGPRRAALEIGSRTAGLFYLLFTAVTVAQNAGPYFAQAEGPLDIAIVTVFSLPMVVLLATGAMIWSTAGAGVFVSVLVARLWLRAGRSPGGPAPGAG